MGCPPPPEEAGERLAGIITDPDVTSLGHDSFHYAPHVLFPGQGNHSVDPMYVTFHGIPNQDELPPGSFTVQTWGSAVSIDNVANYGGGLDIGYSFSADLWVTDACVDDPNNPACGPHLIDLWFEEDAFPATWIVRPDFFIPVPYSPQVINYLKDHATDYDDTTVDMKPGAMVLTPTMFLEAGTDTFPSTIVPAGRFAYVTVQGGAIASMDTSPPNPGQLPHTTAGEESLQQSAHIDLAVIADVDSKLNLFVGEGDGSLQDKRVRDTGGSFTPRAICAADFDLDGDIDLAVANDDDDLDPGDHVVAFWGDGTPEGYTAATIHWCSASDVPTAIAAGDVDGDGDPDLLVADRDDPDSENVSLLENLAGGSGGFADGQGIDTGGGDLRAIVLGRFEDAQDDDLDLVVADYAGDRLKVLKGNGDETFAAALPVTVGDGPVDLVVGDFSGSDPEADLAVLNAGNRTVNILKGDYQQTALFTVVGTLTMPVSSEYTPVSIVTGPFNGSVDERMDLAILLDNKTVPSAADTLLVYYADGDYSFAYPPEFIDLPTDCEPTDLVTGTFNQDNYPDVAVTCAGLTPNEVKVYRGKLDGAGGFYLTHTEEADSGVAAMTVEQFDTQYQDFIYLPEGRNAGYGALIWQHPLNAFGQANKDTRYFLFVSNHTVDPGSVGDLQEWDCKDDSDQPLLDKESGIPVGHTVSVYEINPERFAPTSWRPTNDVLMATLDMDAWTEPGEGCGPQGMAIHSYSDGETIHRYLYVANAYSGSVTAVNLTTLYDSLLVSYGVDDPPPDAEDPITTGVEDYIVVGPRAQLEPGASWTPPFDYPITRAVAFYIGVEQTDDEPPQSVSVWRMYATVSGYLDDGFSQDLDYPGALAKLDIDPRATDPEPRTGGPEYHYLMEHEFFAAVGGEFGEFTVGLIPTRDYKRWLLVNQGYPESVPRKSTLFFYDPGEAYGVQLDLEAGLISGSVALSYDGQRAYVARETVSLFGHSGVVVVDMRPWVPEDQRIIGSLGQGEGVSHVAAFSDPENNVYKIYQSNVDDDIEDPMVGLWVMPEPLVLPYQPSRLLAAFDVSGTYSEQELLQRSYYVQGPEIRDDGAKIVFSRIDDENRDGVVGQGDFGSGEISTMDVEYEYNEVEQRLDVVLKNETRLTHNDFSDLPPTWSPDKMGGSSYKIIFTSHRNCGGCGTGECNDACAMLRDPDADGDLFVMDEDGSNVYQLTDTDDAEEYDADWGKVGSEYWVVFKSAPIVEDPDLKSCDLHAQPPVPGCEAWVSTLWKAEFDPADPTAMLDPVPLTNMYLEDPQGYANSQSGDYFGDFDPAIDPSGQYVLFTRHLDDTLVGQDKLGDWDIFYVPLAGGTVKKLTGECDGDTEVIEEGDEIKPGCANYPNPDPVSADFTPVWSPDPDPSDPDVGPKIAYVSLTEEVKDFYDLFRVENPLNCTLPILPGSPAECQPDKIVLSEPPDPLTRVDERIDSGPFWHPDAFSEGYDGPDLLFDRKLLIDPVAESYLKGLGIP